jgi:hypothetical protein
VVPLPLASSSSSSHATSSDTPGRASTRTSLVPSKQAAVHRGGWRRQHGRGSSSYGEQGLWEAREKDGPRRMAVRRSTAMEHG